MSTFYHSLIYTKAKNFFQIMDHSAVFILIAGTYTPFLIALKGSLGWTLLMGWLIILAIKPLFYLIHLPTFLLLLTGGISYTVGTIFFALKKMPFNYVVWHLFVIIGSACHFPAISTL